jgi:hypothetical protein
VSLTTDAAFAEFLDRIEPTAGQWTNIDARHATATNLLDKHFGGSNMPLAGTELMGSAAKRTIIRPIDDVDIVAQFDNAQSAFEPYRSDSRKFLYRVRQVLTGKRVETVGARGQAVRLFYVGGGHVDIAPLFGIVGGGYFLPAGDGGWITTDPLAGTAWFEQRDVMLDGHLRPLVQLLKKWNRAHSSRMRSFHLETLTATMFTRLGANHRSNLAVFFANADSRLNVSDPTGHSGRLDGYLTATAREALRQQVAAQAERSARAVAAEATGDHAEAMRLWAIVLGSEFPSYG